MIEMIEFVGSHRVHCVKDTSKPADEGRFVSKQIATDVAQPTNPTSMGADNKFLE